VKLFIQTCFTITLLLILGSTVNAGAPLPEIGTIYVVDGSGASSRTLADSNLYILDPSDCSETLVGNIGFSHVTGIAIHPTTGVMYGVSNPATEFINDECEDGTFVDFRGNAGLITIDYTGNGAGALVGCTEIQIPDISFHPDGTLYAWGKINDANDNEDDLYTINLSDGTSTLVGECDCGTGSTGLAIDCTPTIYLKNSNELNIMDPADGTISSGPVDLDQNINNILAFDQLEIMYAGNRTASNTTFSLYTVDPSDGTTSLVCSNDDLPNISAVEFFRGLFPCEEEPEPPSGPTVIIPTMGQWGMIIATMLLGFFAVVALRRTES